MQYNTSGKDSEASVIITCKDALRLSTSASSIDHDISHSSFRNSFLNHHHRLPPLFHPLRTDSLHWLLSTSPFPNGPAQVHAAILKAVMSRQHVTTGVEGPICEWLSAHILTSQLLRFLIAFSPLFGVSQWVLDVCCSFYLLILDSRSRQGIQDRPLGKNRTHIFFSTTITDNFGLFSDRWTIACLTEQCKIIISVAVST